MRRAAPALHPLVRETLERTAKHYDFVYDS